MKARPPLPKLGPWEDRSNIIDLGPEGLLQAWVSRLYAVQRYSVTGRPGWDHLHVQRHDGWPVRSWTHMQAIKAELLHHGDRRLAVEVYPANHRIVDLADAYHLWVLPVNDPLEPLLDFAHELGGLEPLRPPIFVPNEAA